MAEAPNWNEAVKSLESGCLAVVVCLVVIGLLLGLTIAVVVVRL